ncbi:TPA: arginase family protein [Enterobacter kobei]|nr:arginase family protein [Enterobacter asburiae]HCR1911401.1 arginase family protein [Enterobacter kobei]
MIQSRKPAILNFDSAVCNIPEPINVPLQAWQERIRFGCRWSTFRQLEPLISAALTEQYGCVFTGSGDYHHLSYLLLQHLALQEEIQLVICDNHPDNMRYPFGIHCGSWVYWATRLPQIRHVHVIGIGSSDISASHAWENHLGPLVKRKLTYWSTGVDARWLRWLNASHANRAFPDADSLMFEFLQTMDKTLPVYLSIDKDVLRPTVVKTNWDQGIFEEKHLQDMITACQGRIIGADITGEASVYQYKNRFKRWLSAADGQQTPSEMEIARWQHQQNALNLRLLERINDGWRN